MSYEAWRASFQNAEQAAQSAFESTWRQHLRAEEAERGRDDLAANVCNLRDEMNAACNDLGFAQRMALGSNATSMDAVSKAHTRISRALDQKSAASLAEHDKATKIEALDELMDSLTEIGGEITLRAIQGYRDALARGE